MTDEVMTASPRQATPQPSPTRFLFLDALRTIAVCLVIYSHVVGIWFHHHHDRSLTAAIAERIAPLPATLNIGNFGVVLFFLVSGFIVTHTGSTESPRQYAIKRFLRIYPMLLLTVLLAAALFAAHLHPLTTGNPATVTPITILTNAALANYLLAPQVVLVDVAWTLVVEVLFYALLLVALPLLRRTTWPVITAELAVVAAVLATAHRGGQSYFLLAVSISYLPALLLGQIVWATWSRRIPPWAGAILGILAWTEYAFAGAPGLGRQDTVYNYNLNLALGLGLFLVGLLAEPKLKRHPTTWIGYLADRSYSLYLLHGLLAFVVMNLLYPTTGYPLALAAGLAVTVVGAEITYRLVERPAMRLARHLAKKWDNRDIRRICR